MLSGPLIGLGLKQTIALLVDWIPAYPVAVALYYGPSPLPALWAQTLRFFPCAVVMLWPVMRLLPPELHEAAQVDGARPRQELWYFILPLMAAVCLRAGRRSRCDSRLGELGAGKLVATPGSQTFAHEVFTQMHYGVTNDFGGTLPGSVAGGGVGRLPLWYRQSGDGSLRGWRSVLGGMRGYKHYKTVLPKAGCVKPRSFSQHL